MLDSLGCNPEDMLHVSSSLRYDLMSADDLGIVNKVFVNRGHGPGNPAYRYIEITRHRRPARRRRPLSAIATRDASPR